MIIVCVVARRRQSRAHSPIYCGSIDCRFGGSLARVASCEIISSQFSRVYDISVCVLFFSSLFGERERG